MERANGVVSDTLRVFPNGRKDDWDDHLSRPVPLTVTVFTINNLNLNRDRDASESTLGGDLTPFFIDRGANPRLPLSPPRDLTTRTSPPASRRHITRSEMRGCGRWN